MSDMKPQEFATAGSGKSPEEIAFDLVNKLKGQGVWGERNKSAILDMYAECLDATRGLRAYPGQNRIDTPITSPANSPVTNVVTPEVVLEAQDTPPVLPAPTQTVPVANPGPANSAAASQSSMQPVQAQQEQLRQALEQG